MNKKYIIFVLGFLFSYTISAQTISDKHHSDINKSIDIYNSVLKEMDMFYVDSVDVPKLVKNSIVTMLKQLDPYTNYIEEEEVSDFKFMTTGEYGGIGSVISYVDSCIVINEPYEGLPAAKAGLKAGDVILEIDSTSMRNANVKDASDKLKGTPGTIAKIKILRPGEKKPRLFNVTREKITINPVTFAGIVKPQIGYIHFSSFTEKSSDELKKAVINLKNQGAKSLILDLRNNGGGILDEAVNIVSNFVQKNTRVMSTKGKVRQWDRVYYSRQNPIDTLMPLAVLINGSSASSSEIVAGALQDLDRAVIIGERSFGKGLVQTTRQLPYDGVLKVTTSKYYTPSGRCIQIMDYSHRNEDGGVGRIPDSLTHVFKTAHLREVRDGGGITPDIEVIDKNKGSISFYLLMNNIIFKYVTNWVQQHPTIPPIAKFELSDADYENFKHYVKDCDFEYDRLSEKNMQKLKEVMEFEGYMKTASKEFKALEAKLVPNLDRDLEVFKDEIKMFLTSEIIKRYYWQRGAVRYSLKKDKAFDKAVEVLTNPTLYRSTLEPKKKKSTNDTQTSTDLQDKDAA